MSKITSSYPHPFCTIWDLGIVSFVVIFCVKSIVLSPAWLLRYFCVWNGSATWVPVWKDHQAYPNREFCISHKDPLARDRRYRTQELPVRVLCGRNCWKWIGLEGEHWASSARRGSQLQKDRILTIRLSFVPPGKAVASVTNWVILPYVQRFFG